MKTLQGTLGAHLASGVTTLCRCWRVQRADGQVFGFTDHDQQLSFGGDLYKPETGFTRSETESRLGLAVDTMEVEGALSSAAITEDDIALGLWDGAEVTIFAVDWSDTANRAILRKGNLGEIVRGDIAFMAELRGLAHHLNQEKGRTYQRLCDAVVGDARCGVNLNGAALNGAGQVLSVQSRSRVTVSDLDLFADGWFVGGVLRWTGGANNGVRIEVRRHVLEPGPSVRLELWQKAARPIVAGDTFSITAGCDKTFATCQAKFANAANFRGFPHIPGNDFAMGVAKRNEANDGGSFFNG